MSVRKRTWTTSKGEERTAWIAQYLDADGVDRIKTFKTKGEAKDWSATTHSDIKRGTHVVDSKSMIVNEAAEIWIKAVAAGRKGRGPAEASTLRQCRYHVDNYIGPDLGRLKLSRLTKARVIEFSDALVGRISRSLAKKVLGSLKSILGEAVHREKLAVNPAAGIQIGTGGRHKKEVNIPSKADVKAILAKLDELAKNSKAWRRWRAILATAIHTGMRASEIRGLPWSSVDLKTGKISVMQRADENGVIGAVKSKSAKRDISIPASLVQILREWKMECPAGDLAFANGNGNPESLPNIFNRAWVPVQKAALRKAKYNFHGLRHFRASLLIADGANPKDIQTEMGHASIGITYDLYGHLFQDDEADKRRSERAERLAGTLS